MTGPHLDLDTLADLLAAQGTDDAVRHLSGCSACSAALAELDAALPAVSAALDGLDPVGSAPPAFLQRLGLALDREPIPASMAGAAPTAGTASTARPANGVGAVGAPADTPVGVGRTGGGGPGDVLPGVVVPLRPRRAPAVLGIAAAAVGLLAVVGLGAGLVSGSGAADSAGESAGAGGGGLAAAPPGLATSATGNDYAADGVVLLRALPGLLEADPSDQTAFAEQAAPGGGDSGAADSSAADSGAADSRAADSGAADSGLPEPAAASGTGVDPLARLRDPGELAGCLAEVSGPDSDGLPLALDYARFGGQPALVVVLPSARVGKVDVFVVGAGCRPGDDQTLLFSRLDRP